MKWVTRENAKVDRIACPWLIRRFVDHEAEFLFVPGEEVLRVPRIVHAADVEGDLHTSEEGPGLRAVAMGFALLHGRDDHRKLDLEAPMYDALYAWCREQVPQDPS